MTSTIRARATAWLPPLAAALLSRGVAQLAGALDGYATWTARDWARWDSKIYVSIAQEGYFAYECALSEYQPHGWCGNTGWLPGYPLLIRLASWLSIEPYRAGAVLTELFFFASLFVLWNWYLRARLDLDSLLVLALAAFFPGNVYFHATFPMSMTVLCALVLLHAVQAERPAMTTAVGFAAGLSYSTGFLMCSLGGARALLDFPFRHRRRWPSPTAVRAVGIPVLGFLFVIVWQFAATGVWGAFFKIQGNNAFSSVPPFQTLWDPLVTLLQADTWSPDGALDLGKSLQTSLVSAFSVAALVSLARDWRRTRWRLHGRRRELEFLLLGIVLSYLLFPHYLGNPTHSFYRGESLLMPTVLLARAMPKPIKVVFLVAFVEISLRNAALFFSARLV